MVLRFDVYMANSALAIEVSALNGRGMTIRHPKGRTKVVDYLRGVAE